MKRNHACMSVLILVVLLAALPAAAGAPALITAADYADGYTVRLVPAPVLSWTIVPGALPVFLTADGYPAVRTAEGRIVYVGLPSVTVLPVSTVAVSVPAGPLFLASPSWVPVGAPLFVPTRALPVPVGLPALVVR